jgi:integrase
LLPLKCPFGDRKLAGRKPKIVTYQGKPLCSNNGTVIRVSFDKTNKVYWLYKDGKRIISKKEKQDIAAEYYFLADKYNTVEVNDIEVETTADLIEEALDDLGDVEPEITINEDGTVSAKAIHILPPQIIVNEFLKLLQANKYKVAAMANLPILADLDKIEPSIFKKSKIPLSDILAAYNDRIKEPLTPKSKREAKNWLNEFIEIVRLRMGKKPTCIDDFTKENIIAYSNEIYQVATKKNYRYKCKWLSDVQIKYLDMYKQMPKKKWYRDRISKLSTLFNNYLKINMLSDEPEAAIIKTIIDRLKSVQQFGRPKPRPKIMKIEDFQKLYKAGDLRWKCFLACAVNFSFTFIDICDIEKTDLHLDDNFMEMRREKTDEYRCAYLHSLTVKLLKQYSSNDKNNDTDYFFINKNGKPLNADTLRSLFVDFRKRADIDNTIKFKQLRKSVLTVAAKEGCNQIQIDLLSGHSLKGTDPHYIANSKDTVKNACLAVCKNYFKGLTV